MFARLLTFCLVAAATATARAEPIDACSLLTDAELTGLGVAAGAVPARETQAGGVQTCRYQAQAAPEHVGTVSIILSFSVPDRVRQLQALQAKALSENGSAELQVRGEYYADGVMCKVVSAAQGEVDQCIGMTKDSIVGLALTHANPDGRAAFPSEPLALIAKLVSRVAAAGG